MSNSLQEDHPYDVQSSSRKHGKNGMMPNVSLVRAEPVQPLLHATGRMEAILARTRVTGLQARVEVIQRVILRHSSLSLLSPPPLEKQFLISPPCSPPLGWAQTKEMAPVICNFDLMARLASFTIDDKYEVHNGDASTPAIVIHPCETPLDAPSSIEMPRTPRPSSPAY